jgi:hypothetical protein
MLNDMEVGGNAIVQTAREGELGSKAIPRSEQTGLELSSMTLHLVAVLVNGAKIVGTTVDVEDDTVTFVVGSDSVVVVLAHFDPLALQGNLGSSPLPPILTSNSLQTCMAKLGFEEVGRAFEMNFRDGNFFELDPGGSRYPLASKGLDVFDSVLGGIGEELANQAQTLVVRNMGGRFSLERLAVEILLVVLVYAPRWQDD